LTDPVGITIRVGVIVFVIDLLIPYGFGLLPKMPEDLENIVDAALLTAVIGPAVYFVFLAPMVAALNQQLEELRLAKNAADAANIELKQLKFAMDQHAIVSITDREGRIVSCNQRFIDISKYSAEELAGQDHRILNSGYHSRNYIRHLYETIAKGKAWHGQFRNRARDGSSFWVESTVVPIFDAADNIKQYISIRTDITDMKEMEAQLTRAKEDAETANRAKSDFLANMSHEIRTPMNGVIGLTDLLLDSELTVEQREYVEAIKTSGDALLTIINDILDLSKIQAGKLQLDCLPFNLLKTLEECIEIVAMKAREKRLELILEIRPDVPIYLRGDAARIRQVVLNLLSNAIKFTERGEVILSVTQCGVDPTHSEIRFEVKDTGIGIPREFQPNLFQKFSQASNTISRSMGGTGLGLAISKLLAEMMGGCIGVSSEPGKGSTFWFTSNLETEESQPQRDGAALEVFSGERVLIVDDNEALRQVLQRQLNALGFRCDGAGRGCDVLEMLKFEASKHDPYSMLLLDAELPDLEGMDLAISIHGNPAFQKLHIVGLLPSNQQVGARDSRLFGLDAAVIKPIKPSKLTAALAQAFSRAAAQGEARAIFNQAKFNKCLELFDGTIAQRYAQILAVFENDAKPLLVTLRSGCQELDVEKIERGAHGIKGMALELGTIGLSDVASKMNDLAKSDDPMRARELLPQLESERRRLLDFLRSAAPGIPKPGRFTSLRARIAAGNRILVVDDIAINRKLVSILLGKVGYKVVEACSGAEALSALEKEHFDLVIMDVMMPGMDGLEATRRIRACDAEYNDIPILGLTASVFDKDLNNCMSAGMSGRLTKPVHREDLLRMIHEQLNSQSRSTLEQRTC
jgi:PAS domain S-box-containing protein